jgi:hypothetical protein
MTRGRGEAVTELTLTQKPMVGKDIWGITDQNI